MPRASRPVAEGEIFEDGGVPLRQPLLRQGVSMFSGNDKTCTAVRVNDLRGCVRFEHRLEKKPLRGCGWQRMRLVRVWIEKYGIVTARKTSELARKRQANGN